MKFIIETAEHSNAERAPDARCTREKLTYLDYRTVPTLKEARNRHWFNQWHERGVNHREDKERGMVVCEAGQHACWVIDLPNIEALMQFQQWLGCIEIENSDYLEVEKVIRVPADWNEP